MINITKLLSPSAQNDEDIRYGASTRGVRAGTTTANGPVVVWNCTRRCNLRCRHCYAGSGPSDRTPTLSTKQARRFISDLAAFRVPVLLFSGGEPFLREDLLELAVHARSMGIKPTFSTNGTLLTSPVARSLRQVGAGYVGISLDGIGTLNDRLRGQPGAFAQAMQGIDNCKRVGLKVGLRFTISRHNHDSIGEIFDLAEATAIDRICFYHLVYSGRGSAMRQEDITPAETRRALDLIITRAIDFHRRGLNTEILTVDNHADGIYLYLRMRERNPEAADGIARLLRRNGGNRSGMAIAAVDWRGDVHPDQFSRRQILGNVSERPFGAIWTDPNQSLLAALRNRKMLLRGRCRECRWLDLCNGNLRVRAEAITGDYWASDPACFLTDDEVASDGHTH